MIARWKLLVVLPILFAGCTPERQLAHARKLEKKGKFYAAWQAYQEFAANHPQHAGAPEALFHAGWLAQRQLKDCTMADVFYTAVAEKYPKSDPWARLAANQINNCPDYFPLLTGFQWVEGDSETRGKNARIESVCNASPDTRALPSEAGVIVRTYFAGAQKFKTTQLLYKKSQGDVLEFANENDPRSKVVLRLPVKVGDHWKTKAMERTFVYDVLADDKTIKVEAGEFNNCVLVRSMVEGVPGATNEYYAPSVGKVLTSFATPAGEKRNTELLSYKTAPDVEFKSVQTNP